MRLLPLSGSLRRGSYNRLLLDAAARELPGGVGLELAILSALAEIDRRPLAAVVVHEVLLTHGNDDHIGPTTAIVARTGARVVAARDEAGVIAGERPAPAPRLAEWEVPLYEQVTPDVLEAPPVVPDRLVGPGDRLGWQRDAVIVAAPGHTPGHVAAWLEAERVRVAGDALASHDRRRWWACSTPTRGSPSPRPGGSPRSTPRSRASGTASPSVATLPPGSRSSRPGPG